METQTKTAAKVGYFEIQVDDFKKAQNFYKEVFGWKFSKIDIPFEYYMIDTGHKGEGSISGGMVQRQQPLKKDNGISGYVCAIYVDSINETLQKTKKHGGIVTMERTELPGIGHIAYGLDSEGNAFGLWENKD
jgi:predicted enzyme related to lactoylglutathione lyase